MATKGIPGFALGALATGGLLIYAAVTDQPVTDALRNLVKGTAAKPAPFHKPSASEPGSSPAGTAGGIAIGAGPFSELAIAASKYLGRPYRWGGNFDPPDGGGDCSGLVSRSFQDLGISAPRWSSAQLMWKDVRKIRRSEVSAGDLIGHLGVVGHIGIAISNTQAIFAPHAGTVVQVQTIDSVINRTVGIYVRYVGVRAGASGGSAKFQ